MIFYSPLLRLSYRLDTRVCGNSMLELFPLWNLSVSQMDWKIFFLILWYPFMFPPVFATLHWLLVSSDSFRGPYAYSGSIFDVHVGLFFALGFSVDISFSNSSIFGTCALIFTKTVVWFPWIPCSFYWFVCLYGYKYRRYETVLFYFLYFSNAGLHLFVYFFLYITS